MATQDARLWRALPELIDKGAQSERCARSPLQDLAEVDACPDFQSASPEVLKAIVYLAESDSRAVRHDVFRMFSCSRARRSGLDQVLVGWLDRGVLQPATLSFSPLEALHPDMLVSRFGRELQPPGTRRAPRSITTTAPCRTGSKEALRANHWPALEWWFYELPQLANVAPPSRGATMAWVPLQRVLLPGYLADPAAQPEMVSFLLAHGADPRRKLPFDPGRTVIGFAKSINSPVLALLEPPAVPAATATTLARTSVGDGGGGARPPRDGGSRPTRQAARFDPPRGRGRSDPR